MINELVIEKKVCKICKEEKEVTDFYAGRNQCKKCLNAKAHKKDYWENRLRAIYTYQKKIAGCLTDEDNLTLDDVWEILEQQWGHCISCYQPFENNNFTFGHKVSASRGGHLTKSNIQLLHKGCNSKQHSKTVDYLQIRDDRIKEQFELGFKLLKEIIPHLPELLRESTS